ncbi:MAG TPA: ATP-binding protein [Actinomycetota bacterium]|nr:ATP-binding protein [Actinomycetota bacterium]
MKPLTEVADEARRIPAQGLLIFRWLSLAWVAVLAATGTAGTAHPVVTWSTIGVLLVWTAWLTRRPVQRPVELGIDLALGAALVLVGGIAKHPGGLDRGPSLGTLYPISAVVAWGLALGPYGGLGAGAAMSVAVVFARPLNGLAATGHPAALLNSSIGYLLAGGVIGGFARLVDRTARGLEDAMSEALREQAQVVRLRERDNLARQIHDSVLQALALVHKRGRELAAAGPASPAAVAQLAELAHQQEVALRALVIREPAQRPPGFTSVRDALQPALGAAGTLPVDLGVVGTIWLKRRQAEEVAAAVSEALANVVEHAQATRVSVFAEQEDTVVLVSVRDDGRGFTFDEAALRAAHKAGILGSMKGRIEDLGGSISITSAPGRGTEVEFRLPAVQPGGD